MRPHDLAARLKDRGHHQAGDTIQSLLLEIEELKAKATLQKKKADFWQTRCRRLEVANDVPHAVPHLGSVS